MKDLSGYKLVLFDAYNTLIDLDGAHETAIAKILRKEGADVAPDTFHRYWDMRERANLMWAVARKSGPFVTQTGLNIKSLKETFEHFGISGDAESGVELWIELSRRCGPYDDVRQALEALGEHFATGVVSNADNYPLLNIFKREGLDFEAVVTSETARAYKPDPRIFRYALKAFGKRPNEAVYVGDSPDIDIPGAASLGMLTVWIDRAGRGLRAGEPAAARTVRGLPELHGVIEGRTGEPGNEVRGV
jgi:2-haloalkanoic acid dehalogenase type II